MKWDVRIYSETMDILIRKKPTDADRRSNTHRLLPNVLPVVPSEFGLLASDHLIASLVRPRALTWALSS